MRRLIGCLVCSLSFPVVGCGAEPAQGERRGSLNAAGSTPGGSGGMANAGGAGMAQSAGRAAGAPDGQAGSGGARANAVAGGAATAGSAAASAGQGGVGGAGGSSAAPELEPFSFFVTSLAGLRALSGSQNGFGGDLRYGEADGLAGADKICSELAESSMPGASAKRWRALLSASRGPDGEPVHAIDRVGEGPWFDRLGRTLAMTKSALLNERPEGADPQIIDDLPNEFGIPNRTPEPSGEAEDNHHMLTGSDEQGRLDGATSTCDDWTSTEQAAGRPRFGYSWPAPGRTHWLSGEYEAGCGAGVVLEAIGPTDPSNPIVGSGGGYGGFYCFALTP
jgi:hypothetical protein